MANLTFAQTGVMLPDNYTSLWDASIGTYVQRVEKIPLQGMELAYKVSDVPVSGTEGAMEIKMTTWSNIMGLPRKGTDSDPHMWDQPAPGWDTTIAVYTFRRAVRVTETMVRLDRSGHIMQMLSGLPDSGRRMLEYAIADRINSYSSYTGADGYAPFYDSHPAENAGEGAVWDNLETGAPLSPTTFDTARINAARRTGERGYVTPKSPKRIICQAYNEQIARQISSSDKIPNLALMGDNPWKGVDVMRYEYLTGTTPWMLQLDGPESDNGIIYGEMTAPRVTSLGYPTTDLSHVKAGYELYMQFGIGISQLKNLVYNPGA